MSAPVCCEAPECRAAGRKWRVTKGDRTENLVRCEGHAAKLRGKGFEVKLPPKWDLQSTNSLAAAAEYWRKNAGAVMVVVIRATDAVIAVDEGIDADDVAGVLERCVPEAIERLAAKQADATAKRVHQQIRSGLNPEEMRYA